MDRYDVVIVGAGSAGCVLAGRLSEDPTRTVLLLDAGADCPTAQRPVAIAGSDFHAAVAEPGWTWPDLVARTTIVQDPKPYLRGRGVGGSSAVNALIGLVGPRSDYDRWAREYGCDGWAWVDLAASARRIAIPTRPAPLEEWGPVCRSLVVAAGEMAWPSVTDHDAPGAWGAGPAALTRTATGQRVSAADAYVEPARGRRNLTVRGDALVERVLFDGRRAVGVELGDGTVIDAGDVILSAGAIHSPAILLRSGVDNPAVGQGLQDHAAAPLALDLRVPQDVNGLAIASLARLSSGVDDADLQMLPISHVGPGAPGLGILSVALMRVRSRGTVTLDVSAAVTDPTVDLRVLSDERDIDALVVGVRAARRLLDTPAMRSLASGVFLDDLGTPLESLGDDRDAIARWLLGRAGDYVHASCSCRMGAADDPAAVVDLDLRVIGYDGLRVCDASVFPEVPRANTHLPTVLVAERLAERMTAVGPDRRPS